MNELKVEIRKVLQAQVAACADQIGGASSSSNTMRRKVASTNMVQIPDLTGFIPPAEIKEVKVEVEKLVEVPVIKEKIVEKVVEKIVIDEVGMPSYVTIAACALSLILGAILGVVFL